MRVKDAVGRFGEDVACRHLEQVGLQIIERNWRCSAGELDIIAHDGAELVIVEVKTRSTAAFGMPVEAVNRAKVARLRRLAALWIDAQRADVGDGSAGHPVAPVWRSVRIDVIGVLRTAHGQPEIQHIIGAV